MKKVEKLEKKVNSLLYNHLWLKSTLENGFALIVTLFSAFIFAFGVNVFLDPAVLGESTQGIRAMVSGGSSGLAQVFNLVFQIAGVRIENNQSLIFSIFYVLINVPLIILAFKGIGKRFAIYTLINVGTVFILTNVMHGEILAKIALEINEQGGMLARALFAGICTGISSAVAYKIDSSAGGFDIVSYYISLKKSSLAGKYGVIINAVVIASFTVLSAISLNNVAAGISGMWFSLVYLLTVMLVVDVINVRNKKVQIEIITTKKELPKLLLANIPHGATLIDAKGVYTDTNRFIIHIVVSITEVRKAVKIIKQLDPESFVNVTSLLQVYGNFHMKPIK